MGVLGGSADPWLPRAAAAGMLVEAGAEAAGAGEAAATPMASVGEAVVTGARVARSGALDVDARRGGAMRPGQTDKNLCRCFGAPACRDFADHLIT